MAKISDEASRIAYQAAREVYANRITLQNALPLIPIKESSARDYIRNYKQMRMGDEYQRTLNAYATEYFLDNIYKELDTIGLETALAAVEKHLHYYEGLGRGKLPNIWALHKKYATLLDGRKQKGHGSPSRLMPQLSELRPMGQSRIIDLVKAAGVDVSDWGDFKGGEKKAATNPKYCYEWAFIDPINAVVVLNLWHGEMSEEGQDIIQTINFRENAALSKKDIWKRRNLAVDNALKTAISKKLQFA